MQMSWRNMQIQRLLLFFFSLRSNYSKWLRAVLFALCPPSLLPSPSPPIKYPPCLFQMPSSLCCILHFLFQTTPSCHRVSAAITFSITSQWEVNFPGGFLSEPITAGGQAEVKWHDLWVGWSRGRGVVGCKFMANLWNIWIKRWGLQRGDMWWRRRNT